MTDEDNEYYFVNQVIDYMKIIDYEPINNTQFMESVNLCKKFYNCVDDIINEIDKVDFLIKKVSDYIHEYDFIDKEDSKSEIKIIASELIKKCGRNFENCRRSFLDEKLKNVDKLEFIYLDLTATEIIKCIKEKQIFTDKFKKDKHMLNILHESSSSDNYIELTKLIINLGIICVNDSSAEINSSLFPYSRVNFSIKSRKHNSALHIACLTNSAKTAKYLINKGINVNLRNSQKETPAFYCKSLSLLKILDEAGADFSVKAYDLSLLDSACCNGFDNVLPYLVKKKIRIPSKRLYSQSPIFHSVNITILKLMIELGADINYQDNLGNTPLHAFYDNLTFFRELIFTGADFTILNNRGQMPIMRGHHQYLKKEIIEEYLEYKFVNLIFLYTEQKENTSNKFSDFKDKIDDNLNHFVHSVMPFLLPFKIEF